MMAESETLVFVTPLEIFISMAPLVAVAWVSYVMGLDIESPILVGTLRTYIQLSILGFILDPIFARGVELWWLVIAYVLLMTLLATYESSIRSKYYLEGQFWMVLLPFMSSVSFVSIFAFCVVLKPEPRWGT
jgi:putative ABC transport system permease protein